MVLKNRLVETCIKILRLISDKSLHINNIVSQTSSDKSHVIKAIKTIEKAELVKRISSKTHKQMEFLELGQMGNELANLMKNIDEFRESYRSLTESINKNFKFKEYSVMMTELIRMSEKEEKTGVYEKLSRDSIMRQQKRFINKLKSRGWTDTEILSHNQWYEEADMFQYFSARAFIAGLFTKYISLSLKKGSNEVSRAMLTKIIMDTLNQHLTDTYNSFLVSDGEKADGVNKHIWGHISNVFSLNSRIQEYLERYSEDGTARPNYRTMPPTYNFVSKINNRFIGNDVHNVMKSVASMYEHDEWEASDNNKRDSKLENQ